MKFDNFCKFAGSDGVILVAPNGKKWLCYGKTGMLIPENKNVCGNVANMPDYLTELIYEAEYEACELTSAFVPNPDSKPSELMRMFTGMHNTIDISNKAFGFIEKKDSTYIATYEDEETSYTALLVTDDYNEDDLEFKMIYIVKESK